jgi:hypothetical protein
MSSATLRNVDSVEQMPVKLEIAAAIAQRNTTFWVMGQTNASFAEQMLVNLEIAAPIVLQANML